jgi:hypothetical protein
MRKSKGKSTKDKDDDGGEYKIIHTTKKEPPPAQTPNKISGQLQKMLPLECIIQQSL